MTATVTDDTTRDATRRPEDDAERATAQVAGGIPTDVFAESPAPDGVEELRLQLLRLRADFDNYRKRVLRDGNRVATESKEKLFASLLPVVDHFRIGLDSAQYDRDSDPIIQGLLLVFNELLKTLEENGIQPIPVEAGESFDPSVHECIAHVPSEDYAADVIIEEDRRGYRLDGKILRAPRVIVSRGT